MKETIFLSRILKYFLVISVSFFLGFSMAKEIYSCDVDKEFFEVWHKCI